MRTFRDDLWDRAAIPVESDTSALVSAPVLTGTGDGTVSVGPILTFAVGLADITLECVEEITNSGKFEVKIKRPGKDEVSIQSADGTLKLATVAVAYDEEGIAFTIADGAADYDVGDKFKFTSLFGAEIYCGGPGAFVFDVLSGPITNISMTVVAGRTHIAPLRLKAGSAAAILPLAVWNE